MKILLTGGAGYIGSHVSHLLIDNGVEVTIIDSLITGHKELIPKKAKFENCDIADDKKITEIINRDKFDLVMHFAGLIRVDESLKEPEKYNEYNYIKAKSFLNTCIKSNLNKIIFSSTASVYGESNNKKMILGGRLADYAYYDMDMTISAALKKFEQIKKNFN